MASVPSEPRPLDKNTSSTIKLTAAEFEAVTTDKLTTSGGVKKPSLSTRALPISTPVTHKPIAELSNEHTQPVSPFGIRPLPVTKRQASGAKAVITRQERSLCKQTVTNAK
jgi:hypothetical protein